MWYHLVEHLIFFNMIPHLSFQQNIVRAVHLEVVQGGPLNTLIPNTCLQQPISGGPQKLGFAP